MLLFAVFVVLLLLVRNIAVCEGGATELIVFFLFGLNDKPDSEYSGVFLPTKTLLKVFLEFFVPQSTIEEMKSRWHKTFEYERLLKDYKAKQLRAPLPDVTHFLFLMHGHNGQSKDLNYLQAMLQHTADQRISIRNEEHLHEHYPQQSKQENIFIHNILSNQGKTKDGVENGGSRMANEIVYVIQTELQRQKNIAKAEQCKTKLLDRTANITISMVGNSLGGLYARYAAAILAELFRENEDGTFSTVLNNYTVNIIFNVFCTTATPHLGVSKNTYFPIPRGAEVAIAKMMGTTGHDLFCLNDVVHKMATTPYFLSALSKFRKRIAYANAFNTDFPVPTKTAAFLNSKNTYPHHFISAIFGKGNIGENSPPNKKQGFMLAAFITEPKTEADLKQLSSVETSNKDGVNNDDLLEMSISLDALGWKKVFVDVGLGTKSSDPKVDREALSEYTDPPKRLRKTKIKKKNDRNIQEKIIQLLEKENNILESKDLISAFSSWKKKMTLPIGHNRIVAFSRTKVSHLIHQGGRPIMDGLANELIDSIFCWESIEALTIEDFGNETGINESRCESKYEAEDLKT